MSFDTLHDVVEAVTGASNLPGAPDDDDE